MQAAALVDGGNAVVCRQVPSPLGHDTQAGIETVLVCGPIRGQGAVEAFVDDREPNREGVVFEDDPSVDDASVGDQAIFIVRRSGCRWRLLVRTTMSGPPAAT